MVDYSKAHQKYNAPTFQVHICRFKCHISEYIPHYGFTNWHFTQKAWTINAKIKEFSIIVLLYILLLLKSYHLFFSSFQVNVKWTPTQSGMYSLTHNLSVFVFIFKLNEGDGPRTCSFPMYNNRQQHTVHTCKTPLSCQSKVLESDLWLSHQWNLNTMATNQ